MILESLTALKSREALKTLMEEPGRTSKGQRNQWKELEQFEQQNREVLGYHSKCVMNVHESILI